jgi:PIN like domain
LFDEQVSYKKAVEQVEECFRNKIEDLSKNHSSLRSEEDYILNKLLMLFDGKVDEPDSIEILQKICKEGEERYNHNKPPGFKDKDKKNDNGTERKYGDLILWKQVLAFAKTTCHPIVFVTSEKKEDWWYKKEGKIVSPHFELRREFKEQVDRPFWMYQTNRFLEIAKEKLKIEVSQGSIEEANIVAETETTEEQFTPNILQSLQDKKTIDNYKEWVNSVERQHEELRDLDKQREIDSYYQIGGIYSKILQNELEKKNRSRRLLRKLINNSRQKED